MAKKERGSAPARFKYLGLEQKYIAGANRQPGEEFVAGEEHADGLMSFIDSGDVIHIGREGDRPGDEPKAGAGESFSKSGPGDTPAEGDRPGSDRGEGKFDE